jgi:hypothetical protein
MKMPMKKQRAIKHMKRDFVDEQEEWLNLTPEQRIQETTKLWQFYLALGGGFDAQPDPQSPFYFPEI